MKSWNAKGDIKKVARNPTKSEYGNKQYGFSYRFKGVGNKKPKIIESSILPDGYPEGMMLNLVGPPKAGKTIYCLQEAIIASARGDDVLYMINERGRDRFDYTIDKARQRLGLPVGSLKNIEFRDMSTVISKVAQFNAIQNFIQTRYIRPIEEFMSSFNAKIIIIDSLSKAIRTYPAQAYWAVQTLTEGISDVMRRTKKHPVVILVNQKSGSINQRNDESVLGGYGCVHDMDGNIVLRMNAVDKWLSKDTNLNIGSILHTIQIMEIRDMDTDTNEHLINIQDGKLVIGPNIHELYQVAFRLQQNGNGETTKLNNQWSKIR